MPTAGFGAAFVFGEPAVLTEDSTTASIWLATAVTFGLLAAWVAVVLAADRWAVGWLSGGGPWCWPGSGGQPRRRGSR